MGQLLSLVPVLSLYKINTKFLALSLRSAQPYVRTYRRALVPSRTREAAQRVA